VAINDDLDNILFKFDITSTDVAMVRQAGTLIDDTLGDMVGDFYAWIAQHEEYKTYFGGNSHTLQRVQALQMDHWRTFFKANLDEPYFASRRHIGAVHARIDLPNDIYCAGMCLSDRLLNERLRGMAPPPPNLDRMAASVSKMVFLDNYLVLDEISRIQKEKILANSKSLLEMSTPVTPIWEGILLLPLVGIIDSVRTQDIMNKTLSKIGETRAKIFVLDISGVGAVDTAVANQLIKITKATLLMGCESIISGISPAIARTLVELGIQVGDVRTTATLRDALEIALRAIGADQELNGRLHDRRK
jgi:rsbT co-antagonist protein RsbR